MTEADLQKWSREVARDPGAPSFVRLARAYRKQGRPGAARDVVLRGLERNPEHVEAHGLLALIHVEEGERESARDEWETVLRLDPGNFAASRGLGFLALERGELPEARRHLDVAFRARPDDPAVSQARDVLARREGAAHEAPRPEPAGGGAAVRESGVDPARLFAPLAGEPPFIGALVLDDRGLVLAGALKEDHGSGELLAGLLNSVVDEARRAVELLRLGGWTSILLATEGAALHVAPLGRGGHVLLAAERSAPAGWVVRTAGRARAMAERFLEER